MLISLNFSFVDYENVCITRQCSSWILYQSSSSSPECSFHMGFQVLPVTVGATLPVFQGKWMISYHNTKSSTTHVAFQEHHKFLMLIGGISLTWWNMESWAIVWRGAKYCSWTWCVFWQWAICTCIQVIEIVFELFLKYQFCVRPRSQLWIAFIWVEPQLHLYLPIVDACMFLYSHIYMLAYSWICMYGSWGPGCFLVQKLWIKDCSKAIAFLFLKHLQPCTTETNL